MLLFLWRENLISIFGSSEETILNYGLWVILATTAIYPLIVQPWPQKRMWFLVVVGMTPPIFYIWNREALANRLDANLYILDIFALVPITLFYLMLIWLLLPRYQGPKPRRSLESTLFSIFYLFVGVAYLLSRHAIDSSFDWDMNRLDRVFGLVWALSAFIVFSRLNANWPDAYHEYMIQNSLFAPNKPDDDERSNNGG